MHKRVIISFFILMLVFGALILNIFFIGLDTEITETAETANKRSLELSTSRGMIYDCNMKKLVNSNTRHLTVALPDMENLNLLSPFATQSERDQLLDSFSSNKIGLVETDEKFDLEAIKTITIADRYSDYQPLCHIIGHLDSEGNGAMGLEKAYNKYLSQQSGSICAQWAVNALGHILHGDELAFKSDNYLSPAGLQLTIDLEIQKVAESGLINNKIDKGSIVVMNSDTCELLAIASTPIFNPNKLENSLNDKNQPFVNRATSAYSVGSIFKPLVAAVALENNIELSYYCNGSTTVGATVFNCNNSTAHGWLNMTTAMEKSCNCYFIELGQKIGGEKLLNFCESSGLGKGFELADNFQITSGILPKEDDLKSSPALANFSFGQGNLLATPIQMACIYSVFANGGYFREPTLMKAIIDDKGKQMQKVKLPERQLVLSENTINEISHILESVVKNGNGNKAHSTLVTSHGKTATAQSGWFDKNREINHTWFCGYFSCNGIKYTIVIFKEDGTSGAVDCAPIFKEISEKICLLSKSN